MKPLLWMSLISLLPLNSWSKTWTSPLLCPVDKATLVVQNPAAIDRTFWFQIPDSSPFMEAGETVKASQTTLIPLSPLFPAETTAIAMKTVDTTTSFKVLCTDTQTSWAALQDVSPWKKWDVKLGTSSLDLKLLNLAHQANQLEVKFISFLPAKTQTLQLPLDFNLQNWHLELPPLTMSVEFRAVGRWSGMVQTAEGSYSELVGKVVHLSEIPKVHYFLFQSGALPGQDSFVVPIPDGPLADQSLYQIQHPDERRILIARIAKSVAGPNRDWGSTLKNPWSWQVANVLGYADFAHISCDGTPQIVEERLEDWLASTGGEICFWNYHVTRELTREEVMQSPSWWHLAQDSLPPTH